jgi:ribosome-associated protein
MAKRAKKSDSGRKLAIEAARIAEDLNCEEIVVLDLSEVSPVADYFVIATGTSPRQMTTVADGIAEHGGSVGQRVWKTAGRAGGEWIVLDFVDVVVHIFDQAHRRYYDLELIWGDAPKVRWKKPQPRKPKSDGE